jgi:hypothetical protein
VVVDHTRLSGCAKSRSRGGEGSTVPITEQMQQSYARWDELEAVDPQ